MARRIAVEQSNYILAASLVGEDLCFEQTESDIPGSTAAGKPLARFRCVQLRAAEIASPEFAINMSICSFRTLARGGVAADDDRKGE